MRSQVMAPASPAKITVASTAARSTSPLPIVLATAVPNRNTAMKLNAAAHTTAADGDNTRVDTTVAMEFAASWNPLMKSKHSATPTMATTNQADACVERALEVVVDLLPLDHFEGVPLGLEHPAEGLVVERVALFLELLGLDAEPHHIVAFFQPADAFGKHAHHTLDYLGELVHAARRGTEMEDLGAPRDAVDHVHHVVQVGGELMDVLPVERRDEGAVQPVHHLVGDLVGLVLEPLDRLDVGDATLGGRGEEVAQMLGRLFGPRGHRDEQVEELFFPGQQAHGSVSRVKGGGARR